MIKLFIVDDHALIREGLKKVLSTEPDIKLMGEATTGRGALEMMEQNSCDILILDISLPDMNGLEILKKLKKDSPKIRVLILSIHPEERYALRALKDGADGYLTKNTVVEDLISAVRSIMAGNKYVSAAFTTTLIQYLDKDKQRLPHEALSDREFQILLLLASGKTVTHIADELNLGLSTVNTYRLHILEKMNLQTNMDIMRYVLDHRLAEEDS